MDKFLTIFEAEFQVFETNGQNPEKLVRFEFRLVLLRICVLTSPYPRGLLGVTRKPVSESSDIHRCFHRRERQTVVLIQFLLFASVAIGTWSPKYSLPPDVIFPKYSVPFRNTPVIYPKAGRVAR